MHYKICILTICGIVNALSLTAFKGIVLKTDRVTPAVALLDKRILGTKAVLLGRRHVSVRQSKASVLRVAKLRTDPKRCVRNAARVIRLYRRVAHGDCIRHLSRLLLKLRYQRFNLQETIMNVNALYELKQHNFVSFMFGSFKYQYYSSVTN